MSLCVGRTRQRPPHTQTHLLPTIAKLPGFLMCLLRLLFLPQAIKSTAFAIVGIGIVGIETDSLVVSGEGILIALEIVEIKALVVVGIGIVGIEADGLVISGEGILIALKAVESIAFLYPLLFGL